MTIYIGGCFNHLHAGHEAMLDRCVELYKAVKHQKIWVSLMSDLYLARKYPNAPDRWFESWTTRLVNIKEYLISKGVSKNNIRFESCSDATVIPDDGYLVVSEESAERAAKLIGQNMSHVLMSVVPLVTKADGTKISSSDTLTKEEKRK